MIRLDHSPSLPRLYARSVVSARGRHGDRLPDKTLELADVTIDRDRLARYDEVCGFRHSDVLPLTYPHILGFPLAVTLMVDPAFPYPLAGMVHVNNRITQMRALRADERLSVSVHAENLRDHPRGRQFEMVTTVTIGGQEVWNESSTYLRRLATSASAPGQKPPPSSAGEDRDGSFQPTAIWRIPANIGRRYAAVSGDVNPIHLNPLAAKLFGFRRTIAHGMWLKARCLAALEGRLPDAMTASVEFKSPLLLPSTVAFSARPGDEGWAIGVQHASSGRPHLRGGITAARGL
ncbi:MAG TPA: MaoC/PaaZ C-terminal domain-containing protein [Candidatus Acidoferrum sp.]|nr:MaoC/PaaZ C-terminal domain-containing protein [Candidatus Acidoferrum sp.]